MYGTMAHLRVRKGMGEQLVSLIKEYRSATIPGFISTHILHADADPDEYYLLAVFEDRDSYRRNADDPEQDSRYRRMRELLDADPEWHDGDIVAMDVSGA